MAICFDPSGQIRQNLVTISFADNLDFFLVFAQKGIVWGLLGVIFMGYFQMGLFRTHGIYFLCKTKYHKNYCYHRILTLVLLNKLRCPTISNFHPIRLLDQNCRYKFTYLKANRADPDQLASKPTDLDLHFLQRQDISGFSRAKVKLIPL